MIRALKIWLAQRKLQKLVEQRRERLARDGFHKRSQASRQGWARRRIATR